MDLDEHARHLGGLLGNLQSLEFALRIFLTHLPGARPISAPSGFDLYAAALGAYVPESDMTSYDTLSRLIAKFNKEMIRRGAPLLDASVIELRDALAHGRVSAPLPDEHLRLLKFSKPVNGVVQVTFSEVMNEEWFKNQKARVYALIRQVQGQIPP